jgi:hypothetical protein
MLLKATFSSFELAPGYAKAGHDYAKAGHATQPPAGPWDPLRGVGCRDGFRAGGAGGG